MVFIFLLNKKYALHPVILVTAERTCLLGRIQCYIGVESGVKSVLNSCTTY